MNEFLQYLLEFGLGAVFAGVMFAVYRTTIKQMREDRKYMEDKLIQVIKDYNESCSSTRDALLENTKIQSELYTWLKGKNGHN